MHNLRGVEQHWERGKLWCGGGSCGGGGGLNCGPPASINLGHILHD